MRTFEEIAKDFMDMSKMSCVPSFMKPKANEIIDEDKSVRWNREEIERLRKAYDDEVARLNTEKNKRRDSLYAETYKKIRHEIKGISEDDAKAIVNYVWANNKSETYTVKYYDLENLVDLIRTIIKNKEKEEKKR